SASVSVLNASSLTVEVGKLAPPMTIGEVGILLNEPRTATVVATSTLLALRFEAAAFHRMLEVVPAFGRAVSPGLANRLHQVPSQVPKAEADGEFQRPPREVLSMLPVGFMQRHRAVP